MNKNYLQLDFKKGQFFEYSSEPKNGYVKNTSSKGNVSYRKYYTEGVAGTLESVSIYEGKFGKQISISLKYNNDIYYVPIDIQDQKGNVDVYSESLIKLLPLLQKGDQLILRAYNFVPKDEKYAKIGISITSNGEKLKSNIKNSYYDRSGNLVENQIPAIKWKEDALGKKKPTASSLEEKDDYLLNILKTETDRLKWVGVETPSYDSNYNEKSSGSLTSSSKDTNIDSKEEFVDAEIVNSSEKDDLPF